MKRSIASTVARVRSLLRGVVRRGQIEAEMSEEIRHHIALRAEHLVREGVGAREAARRARLEFGHVDGIEQDARAARGLRIIDRIGFSWLDVKLGARMLAKHPGLSLVSVFGMSVAIAIGAGGFGLIHAVLDAPLPLDEGGRVVALQNMDTRSPGNPPRPTIHDLTFWRASLGSVRDVSATMDREHALVVDGRASEVVRVAHMSAAGFRVARVAPLLGRPLLDDDERPGAPAVLVIGYDVWQNRFGGDVGIVGRQVRLGAAAHTIIGVMPDGFRFPVDHAYWAPLRLEPTVYEVGDGPALFVFGRLADGVATEQAQAEMTTLGARAAADHPATHAHLRPMVRPYIHPFVDIESPARALLVRTLQLGLSLLLVLVATNVAVLVYARTASRLGEITVRTALGASRRRVVMQLFAEALVLSAIATVIGVAMAALVFDVIRDLLAGGDGIPFWVQFRLSPVMIAYVAGLTLLAAAIVGAAPALKATGRDVQGRLQQLSAKGSRMKLGRLWTALIVVQVAVAVAILPYALWVGRALAQGAAAAPDYDVDSFVRSTLSIAPAVPGTPIPAEAAGRFATDVAEVVRRLRAEPAIAGVAFASRYPGTEFSQEVEVEGVADRFFHWTNDVDVGLFDLFDVRVLAGRGFVAADATPGANVAVVDRAFVDEFAGGGSVIGRRVRLVQRAADGTAVAGGPWLEVVGVVETFVPAPPFERDAPRIYRPLAPAAVGTTIPLAVRFRPDTPPTDVLILIREIATSVDPEIRLMQRTATEEWLALRKGYFSLAMLIAAVSASVLLLSAAGVYALMSFAVVSRRREIGIRSALGAAPRALLAGIFRRAALQLGGGVLAGLLLAEAIPRVQGGSFFAGDGAWILLPITAVLITVGFIAVVGPARRGLAIQPTEALREE